MLGPLRMWISMTWYTPQHVRAAVTRPFLTQAKGVATPDYWKGGIYILYKVYIRPGADLALKCYSVPNQNVDMTVHQGGCGSMSLEEHFYFWPVKKPIWCNLGVHLHFSSLTRRCMEKWSTEQQINNNENK